MSADGPNGISERILEAVLEVKGLQVEQSARIGQIDGRLAGLEGHAATVNRRLKAGSKRMRDLGDRMMKLEQRQAVAEEKSAGFCEVVETGGEQLARLKAEAERKAAAEEAVAADRAHRWQRFAWVVGVAISLCGLMQAGKCALTTKAAPTGRDAAAQSARR